MRITVVTPTYNEAENLPGLVSALFALPLELRLLVVDDNSPDGTGRIADELAAADDRVRVLHRAGKLGLRSAYIEGFARALAEDAEAVVQMDADFSHDPAALPGMARLLESCDVVLGSRYTRGGSVDRDWPVWRKGLSAFANFYARTLLGMPMRDVTTGYRLWRSKTLEGMPLDRVRSNGYIFLVEMVYLAHCLEYRICESPIYFADRRRGKSKMSFKIQAEAAARIWQVLWNYRDLRKKRGGARVERTSNQ
ncbi:MAG: polyprenol monophosphomannose synthase [Bacteroidota bacterium]